MKDPRSAQRIAWTAGGLLALVALVLWRTVPPAPEPIRPPPPARLATWPWPQADREETFPGVTHWLDHSSPDGTTCELFDFDFAANPRLRLELYDQDEDDAHPFDNQTRYWARGVGQATAHLNALGRGPVLAAWNGLFFNTGTGYAGPQAVGGHVAPVVLGGRVRENVGLVRWAFGVKYDARGRPTFQALHEPGRATLGRAFTFAAEGAQCLIQGGRPLHLQPYPQPSDPATPTPVPSTPQEAGYVPGVDHMQTSRTSMAWSKDSLHLYLLIVKTPLLEGASIQALREDRADGGGWMVSDEQRFWQALGAWGAVNIDGGDVTQFTMLRKDGQYDLVPPHWADSHERLTFSPAFAGAPAGGTMMYFYICDLPETHPAFKLRH